MFAHTTATATATAAAAAAAAAAASAFHSPPPLALPPSSFSSRTATEELGRLRVLSSLPSSVAPDQRKRGGEEVLVPPPSSTMMMQLDDDEASAKRLRASPSAAAAGSISSSSIHAFPFELRLRALRLEEAEQEPALHLAMAEIGHSAGAPKPNDVPVDYVLVLDKSGSMQGVRRSNMLQGLRALLQLLPNTNATADVTLVAFDDRASAIYGPGSPAGALEQWDAIADALQASGSTSIEEALRVALRAADAALQRGRAVIMLLLTDGDDADFARNVARYRETDGGADSVPKGCGAVLAQLGSRSGLATHFVGICSDADAPLLDGLAQLSMGTFVSIADADIKGLMGSLLGLAMEKLNHGAVLSAVRLLADGVGEEEVLAPRTIHLRVGTPTRIPFRLYDVDADADASGSFVVRLKLELFPIGALMPHWTSLETSPEVMRVVTQDVRISKTPQQDWSVALEHARAWQGEAAALMTQAMAALRHDPAGSADATDRHNALVARTRRVVAAAAAAGEAAGQLSALLEAMEARAAQMLLARDNYQLMREFSARCISDASTARNGGISIGDARAESAGQAAMRSLSMQY